MPFKVSVHDSTLEIQAVADAFLFELMKNADDDPGKAKIAWTEFYRRHSPYLWNCCLKVCKSAIEGDKLARDIFQSTMHKIYSQAKTYQPEKANGIKAWISRIAHNEFIDYYKKYNANFSSFDMAPEIEDDVADSDDEHELAGKLLSIHSEQLKMLLGKLSKKEFKILMTCMNYYQLDKPNAHLPDAEMDKLCKEFSIKSDAVRQIKRRALIKLQKLAKELKP